MRHVGETSPPPARFGAAKFGNERGLAYDRLVGGATAFARERRVDAAELEIVRDQPCSAAAHERLKADPARLIAMATRIAPWPGAGMMVNCPCGSSLILRTAEYDAGIARLMMDRPHGGRKAESHGDHESDGD